MVRPTAKTATPPSRPAAKPSRRQKKVTFRGPEPVIDALKLDALKQKTTIRNLILRSLRESGYAVIDEDLVPGAGGSD